MQPSSQPSSAPSMSTAGNDHVTAAESVPSKAVATRYDAAPPPSQPEQHREASNEECHKPSVVAGDEAGAYTEFAASLNTAFERFHLDNTMRPTIIRAAPDNWQKVSQRSLIQSIKQKDKSLLAADDLRRAKQEAFALLDAVTRSGGLAIEHADLHLLVASTHRFDKSLMQTLMQDNVNPIERVEKSAVVMAATLYGVSNVTSLLKQGVASLAQVNVQPLKLLV